MKQLIIMPVHNAPDYTKKSLEALARTTDLTANQLCVIDDSSRAETQEVLLKFKKAHPEIRLFANKKNSGKPASVDAIMHLFPKAPYFTIIDNDVVIQSKNWVETLLKCHKIFNNTYILGAHIQEDGFPFKKSGYHFLEPYPYMNLAGNFFSIPNKIFQTAGYLFDGGYRHEDAEYCRRASLAGFRWAYIKEIKAETYKLPDTHPDRATLLKVDATERLTIYKKRMLHMMTTREIYYQPKTFSRLLEIVL